MNNTVMPELIAPTAALHSAWLDAHAEWGPGLHEDGFGLAPGDDVRSPDGFAAWLARLADQSDPAKTTDAGRSLYRRATCSQSATATTSVRGSAPRWR